MVSPRNLKQVALHKQGHRIFDRARKYSALGDEVALSAITVAELEFGARRSRQYERERSLLQRILLPFIHLDFEAKECAGSYGKIRHDLEVRGCTIGSLDTLIAAHALATKATLVTNNTRELNRVNGLLVANWSVNS